MRLWAVVVACALVSSCKEDGPVGPTVPVNERFMLPAGATASIDRTGLRLRFERVSGDSRCPADAVCIQGGDAVVHIVVADGGVETPHELHTSDPARGQATQGRYRIALVELQPYPFSSRTIAPGDYRATFTVSEF
jgi:hypothetical protein